MTEVYINNERLDLQDRDVVSLTKQINDIAEIQRRQADFTNRFTVRKTPTNMRIFEMLNTVGNTSTAPYKFADATIISDGITIAYRGTALVSETRNRNEYEVAIYAGNYDLFSRIDGKYITDLDWTDLSHTFNETNWISSWENEEGYVYALAETLDGRLSNYGYGAGIGEVSIDIGKQFPWMFVRTIWDRIFSEAGLSYDGAVFDSDDFRNEILLAGRDFSKEVKTNYDNFEAVTAYPAPNGLEYYYDTPPISRITQQIDLDVSIVASVNYDFPTDTYTVPESGTYQFTFKARLAVMALQYFRIFIKVNGVTKLTLTEAYNQANPDYYLRELMLSGSLALTEGDSVTFFFYLDNTRDDIALAVKVGFVIATIQQTSRTARFYSTTIDFSECLPKVKQIDFLKAIMQQYGLVYKQNNDGSFSFARIEDILSGRYGVVDLTEKLHEEVSETYQISSPGKTNTFKYQYSDADKLGTGYADDEFMLDFDNIPTENTVMDSPIEAAGDFLTYDAWQKIASVHGYNNTESDSTKPPGYQLNDNSRMVTAKKAMHYVEYMAYGNDSSYIGFDFAQMQAVAQFKDLHWSVLTEKYYAKWIAMMSKPVKKKVKVWFTPVDIYQLDMFQIAYFEQYQSYFYINKVNNFVAGKPTELELIKIN